MSNSEWFYINTGFDYKTLACTGQLSPEMRTEIIKGEYEQLSLGNGEWPDLKFIRDLPIRYVTINSTDGFDLDSVLQLRSLKGLDFKNLSERSSLDLSSLVTLEKLNVFSAKNVSFPSSIRILRLSNYKSSIDNLFSQVDDLIYLRIAGARSTTEIQGLSKFKNLLKLELEELPKLDSIQSIASIDSLKSLSVTVCKKVSDVATVDNMTKLVDLRLAKTEPVNSLAFLNELKELESFVLGTGTVVLDDNLRPILDLPALKFCEISNTRSYNLKNKDIREHLKNKYNRLPKFEELTESLPWITSNPWRIEEVLNRDLIS